ncbi:hypothetical protein FJP69_05620 [Stenotrophomonas maltophilia]|nr:hypothetical protein FJP69_05620 [Stenotrophomonas maltophilia]CRD52822.1 hypothetical protein BN1263430069 [Stenotrophomonas indicatrix]
MASQLQQARRLAEARTRELERVKEALEPLRPPATATAKSRPMDPRAFGQVRAAPGDQCLSRREGMCSEVSKLRHYSLSAALM